MCKEEKMTVEAARQDEFSFEEKVRQLIRQIERREAKIVFDPQTETVDIVPRDAATFRG